MTSVRILLALVCVAAVSACDRADPVATLPDPLELGGDEIGYFCNMNVSTHRGPKGQVFLSDRAEPLWFTSARDTIAFTMLPGEPKNISAVYVSDMGRAEWDHPGPGTWVDARAAWYVVGSSAVGGMGAPEPVPFSDRALAQAFQAKHAGRVVSFDDIPTETVLGFDGPTSAHAAVTQEEEAN